MEAQVRQETKIDTKRIQMLEEAGIDIPSGLLGNLVEMFVQNTTQRLNEMCSHLEAQKLADVGRVAHNLKASCGTLGSDSMAEVAKFIELQARSEKSEGILGAIQTLRTQFPGVEKQLRNYLASVPI